MVKETGKKRMQKRKGMKGRKMERKMEEEEKGKGRER